MAQTYEIDIKRFNGQDYDTLLPTPAAHASTHQANGSDPIIMQTGNYGSGTVTEEKIAPNAVSKTLTVTLVAASWSNNEQAVTANEVTTNNTVIVSPEPSAENYAAYTENAVRCTAQGAGTLTFVCEYTPSTNIIVNVTVINK